MQGAQRSSAQPIQMLTINYWIASSFVALIPRNDGLRLVGYVRGSQCRPFLITSEPPKRVWEFYNYHFTN
ncbi:MAG: hypothetical protein LBH30_02495 [Prevotellaceae bacterium]|nr:hypothetical protein [Prevotellaceae bacterium]